MGTTKKEISMNDFNVHKTGYKGEWMVVYLVDGKVDYQHRGTKGRGVKFFYTRRDALHSGNTWKRKSKCVS